MNKLHIYHFFHPENEINHPIPGIITIKYLYFIILNRNNNPAIRRSQSIFTVLFQFQKLMRHNTGFYFQYIYIIVYTT